MITLHFNKLQKPSEQTFSTLKLAIKSMCKRFWENGGTSFTIVDEDSQTVYTLSPENTERNSIFQKHVAIGYSCKTVQP